MKQFIYNVKGHTFADTEAFGDAWKQAKEKAAELHAPIYRCVVEMRNEVYLTAGVFIDVGHAKHAAIKIFGEE